MVTSIGTLSVMLLLARMPLYNMDFGGAAMLAYRSTQDAPDHIPIITAHEIRRDAPQRPIEQFLPQDALPESDFAPDALAELDVMPEPWERRVSLRPAAAVAATTLHDLYETASFMHTALATPVVDDPPRLRFGSMLVDYPISALRKAVEGLVIVRFLVETDGRAYGIDIVSSLEPTCDAAVIDALRDARFIPGKANGRSVPALTQMSVRFKIEQRSGLY